MCWLLTWSSACFFYRSNNVILSHIERGFSPFGLGKPLDEWPLNVWKKVGFLNPLALLAINDEDLWLSLWSLGFSATLKVWANLSIAKPFWVFFGVASNFFRLGSKSWMKFNFPILSSFYTLLMFLKFWEKGRPEVLIFGDSAFAVLISSLIYEFKYRFVLSGLKFGDL